MEKRMYGVGEVARASGLSISALRFYDSAGVLVPAWVDPRSGYRWYDTDQVAQARVVARLRRVQMPLEQISLVLNGRGDPEVVEGVLAGHLHRLEAGLADARHELSTVRELLTHQELTMPKTAPTCVSVIGKDLAAALAAVRHAASADAGLPMLRGVLFDVEDHQVTVVATDRYRMAIATAATTQLSGPPVQVIVPLALVDAVITALEGDASSVLVDIDGDQITAHTSDRPLQGQRLEGDFPRYRQLVPTGGAHRARIDVAQLRQDLQAAPVRTLQRAQDGVDFDVAVLSFDANGDVALTPTSDAAVQVWMNREFLLQALDASDAPQLTLELDGPISPLAIRNPQRADHLALLMPTRLD